MAFVKHAALQFQQLRAKRLAEVEKAEKVEKTKIFSGLRGILNQVVEQLILIPCSNWQDKEDNEKETLALKAITEGEIQNDVAKKKN